jgi:hypothetical protein
LFGQVSNLCQQLAKVVDAVFGDNCSHGGLAFVCNLPCNYCLVSDASLTQT